MAKITINSYVDRTINRHSLKIFFNVMFLLFGIFIQVKMM